MIRVSKHTLRFSNKEKLEALSEFEGFKLIKVDPAYTSQTCSKCGQVIKANRQR